MIPAARSKRPPGSSLPLGRWHPASTLGAGLLAVLSALLLPLPLLLPLAGSVGWLLWRTGWRPAGLLACWKIWTPLLLIVLGAHTLTAVDAAPLGMPSWIGLGRGLTALARLASMFASAAVTMRLLPLPLLSAGLAWWLRPLRRCGFDGRHLDLVLAVAAGTAPRTLSEASRLRDCLRLRMNTSSVAGHRVESNCAVDRSGLIRPICMRLREYWLVVPPLMEGLVRRSESLPLALIGRAPQAATEIRPLPVWQALLLVLWAVLLVLAIR